MQLGHHLLRQLAYIGVAPLEAASRYAREVEQVLDQLPHALRGGPDSRQVALCLLRHILREVLQERLAEAVDGTQRRAQVVGHGVAERLELSVRIFQLRGSLLHASFQLCVQPEDFLLGAIMLGDLAAKDFVRRLQVAGRALDFGEHRVEALREHADLVLAQLGRAQRERALLGHFPRDVRDREQRAGDNVLKLARQDVGHQHRYRRDDCGYPEIADQPVVELIIRAQVHRAEHLPAVADALEQNQLIALDAGYIGLRQLRKLPAVRARIAGEDFSPGVVNRRGADLRAVMKQLEVFLRHPGIVEGQRRRRGPPEQIRLRRHVGDQALPVSSQVEAHHHSDRDEERRQRRDKHDRQQLLAHRKRGDQSPHQELVSTLRATARSRALILRAPRSACGSATSKRTLSSTKTKLIMLPCARASSDSVTVRTDCPFATARISASRAPSAWPMKSIWIPATDSPRRMRRTTTARSRTVRPFTICSSSAASSSAPITPMVKGLSGRVNAFGGHSTKPLNL